MSNGYFKTVVPIDFEFEIDRGGLPRPLCMVAYVLDEHLERVRTIRLWRGEFGSAPPFDIGDDGVICGYSLQAEMMCFDAIRWPRPVHLLDQHVCHLAETNTLLPHDPDETRKRPPKRLSDACRYHGITGWENVNKSAMAKDIGEGRWREYGREAVLAYCEEDTRKSTQLLRAQLRGLSPLDIERRLHWSTYAGKVVAQIQAVGMPIDRELWDLVQEHKQAEIAALIRKFDPSHGTEYAIYSPDGEWNDVRFEQWLAATGVTAWPRLPSGKISLKRDTFRQMAHVPGVEGLSALRDGLRVIASATLPIGPDNRNRPSLFPLGAATGRNAHARSLYNAHAGMRSFTKFSPDKVGVYLDWKSQEVAVGAALSGDTALIEAYESDVYHSLAVTCGLTNYTDPVLWKEDHPGMRQRMKSLQLGLNYGMTVPSLARGLNVHPTVAGAFMEAHRLKHSRFYEWRENAVTGAMLSRKIEAVDGWPLHLSVSPNKRTLYNYGCQANGAVMLRQAAWRLYEAGLVPVMLIHDGILFEFDYGDHEEKIQHAVEIMKQAGRDVCGDRLEVGVDVERLIGGARYRDKRPLAKAMWATMMTTLQEIGAIPEGPLP